MNESIRNLEEKIAYLERHVAEQDRAMLEMTEDVGRLRRELKSLRDRSAGGAGSARPPADEAPPADERPPHY